MHPELTQLQLFRWLKGRSDDLARRTLDVRAELSKWLPYVSQLFPHYPSHGLDHSDRIVAQLSRLLFVKRTPSVDFSAAEVYCLLCAAYVHDMGMVVSQGEQNAILSTPEWHEYISENGGGYAAFEEYRKISKSADTDQKDFIAGRLLRLLIAEFVRRTHHQRSKDALQLHPFLKQLVDAGDPVAFETIGDISVGHGLPDTELADQRRFPEQRDVFDGKVNVRFLTRLLRIGDLLDVNTDRTDPTTERAIGPLPLEAQPHWRQYSSKRHENITPDVIEFRFECKDQQTHRVLRDWFAWLETEIRNTGLEQLHAARHGLWKPPRCGVASQSSAGQHSNTTGATITIEPAQDAKYFFHDWKLELDQERVLHRLINDIYGNPALFIRELIQNALDATRCQMYSDFARANPNMMAPKRPTQFPKAFRDCYPITLSLSTEDVLLSPDGPREPCLVFTIEDRGLGMDEETIRRYFLQIGRSYYKSPEFRQRFKFVPTSQFGIGFLSVFAVSNDITVDTAKLGNQIASNSGIRLHLREPRSYLLTEPWDAFPERPIERRAGTRIRVVLTNWDEKRNLGTLVKDWCVATEVPIVIKGEDCDEVIEYVELENNAVVGFGATEPDSQFLLRTFTIEAPDVEGQIAVIAYVSPFGEGWCRCWPEVMGLDGESIQQIPKADKSFTALHGIRYGGSPADVGYRSMWIQRCDVRSPAVEVSLARTQALRAGLGDGATDSVRSLAAAAVRELAERIVKEHLQQSARARGDLGVYYIQNVISSAPVSQRWQLDYPATVLVWRDGSRSGLSVAEFESLDEFTLAGWLVPSKYMPAPPPQRHPRSCSCSHVVVSPSDVPRFWREGFVQHIKSLNLINLVVKDDLWQLTFSRYQTNSSFQRASPDTSAWIVPTLAGDRALANYGFVSTTDLVLLNRTHPLVGWIERLRSEVDAGHTQLNREHVNALWEKASNKHWEFGRLISLWEHDISVPAELRPPKNSKGQLVRFDYVDLIGRRTARVAAFRSEAVA